MPQESLYTDNLTLPAVSEYELRRKLIKWQTALDEVNAPEMKIIFNGKCIMNVAVTVNYLYKYVAGVWAVLHYCVSLSEVIGVIVV